MPESWTLPGASGIPGQGEPLRGPKHEEQMVGHPPHAQLIHNKKRDQKCEAVLLFAIMKKIDASAN